MKVRVFFPNHNGKIEFTKAELEKLLNEVYAEGQNDCNCGHHITWPSPYITPLGSCSDSTTNQSAGAYSKLGKELNFNETTESC